MDGKLVVQLIVASHRPQGHHAEANCCMGFCIFNNVAMVPQVAIEKHGLQRYVGEL